MITGTPEEIAGRLAHAERKAREWQEEATKLREVVMATEGIKPLNTNLDPETAAIFRDNYGPGLLAWAEDSARRIAALEAQVRIMEKILEKLVTLHPEAQPEVPEWKARYEARSVALFEELEAKAEAQEAEATGNVILNPGEAFEMDHNTGICRVVPYREAKLQAERESEDLYLQRRRNFPLDPPTSATDDDNW